MHYCPLPARACILPTLSPTPPCPPAPPLLPPGSGPGGSGALWRVHRGCLGLDWSRFLLGLPAHLFLGGGHCPDPHPAAQAATHRCGCLTAGLCWLHGVPWGLNPSSQAAETRVAAPHLLCSHTACSCTLCCAVSEEAQKEVLRQGILGKLQRLADQQAHQVGVSAAAQLIPA